MFDSKVWYGFENRHKRTGNAAAETRALKLVHSTNRATNLGLVTRYGPPTDPALDAVPDNDHRTTWRTLDWSERRLILELFVLSGLFYWWLAV